MISVFITPQVEIRGALHLRVGIGYVPGRTFGPVSTLTVVLDLNCRDVVTAYPGSPYSR